MLKPSTKKLIRGRARIPRGEFKQLRKDTANRMRKMSKPQRRAYMSG